MFHAVLIDSAAAQMRAMRQYAQRQMLKSLPLFKVIIADVIARLIDIFAVYMALAAVHNSSYMGGAVDSTRVNGLSTQVMCRCDDKSAAAAHALR